MVNNPTSTHSGSAAPQSNNHRAMSIVAILFFMWGFLTSLNDILVPHLKAIFDLNYARVMLINSAFFGAYFVFALPSGKVVEWLGYQKSMVLGLITMSVGAMLFVPAANKPSFGLFLGALIVLASGVTLLQVAANPYVAILGPPETASSRLNLTQAFNSLGTTVAPYLGSLLILSAPPAASQLLHLSSNALTSYRQQQASSVKVPYVGIAIALAALAFLIGKSRLPKIETRDQIPGELFSKAEHSLLRHRQLLFGAIGIFTYVGAEVSIGSFLSNYLSQPDIGGMSIRVAAGFVSFYWLGAMIGRFLGSAILRRVPTGRLLGIFAIVAFTLVGTSIASKGFVAMWSIILVGLFNSIMFPSIFTLGIDGLGPMTGRGSGVMIMAVVGGAIIPVIEGALADRIGIHHALIIPALCYVYVAFYGFNGSRHSSQGQSLTAISDSSST